MPLKTNGREPKRELELNDRLFPGIILLNFKFLASDALRSEHFVDGKQGRQTFCRVLNANFIISLVDGVAS